MHGKIKTVDAMKIMRLLPREVVDKICDLMYTLQIDTFEEVLSLLLYITRFNGDIENVTDYLVETFDIDRDRIDIV